jgi:F0F1-type ATP synthase assembly protein I
MKKLQKFARMTALASSVVFELMAGPFLGYFIGLFMVKKLHMNAVALSISVFIGFIVSLYAAMLTIMKINKIDEKSKSDQTRD